MGLEAHLGSVEDNRWETSRHLRIEANFDTRLDFVLTLHQKVEQWHSGACGLAEVRHETNECGVPLVHDLRESRRARGHEDLAYAIVESLH